MRTRYYIGHKHGAKVVFQSSEIPTASAYPQYTAVTWPNNLALCKCNSAYLTGRANND